MKENYTERRQRVFEQMGENDVLLLYSGVSVPSSMDETFPFEVDRHFYYLTGLRRENMALLMSKTGGNQKEMLFIEPAIPAMERWTGKRVTREEATAVSGISDIRFIQAVEEQAGRILARENPAALWMDCHRENIHAPECYNMQQARAFRERYPALPMKDLHHMVSRLRMRKDDEEVALFREAVELTHAGLNRVLETLRPGMMEYAVQAEFEYEIRRSGAEAVSFPTVAGSGINACSLHYRENSSEVEPGSLLLLDLGARYKGYCADISRTYPADGHFTEQQRRYYDLVLKANREVALRARPGETLKSLNEFCKQILAEGLMEMGKISKAEDVGKYYMHGVSHFIGLDTHDVYDRLDRPLEPGMIISDEPGLYIDEEKIGIRIEDDLLITESGCIVLSEDIEREPEEIEALMHREVRA